MRRRAFSWALAALLGVIAVSLLSGPAAADGGGSSGAPKSLTHRFPLGSHTLSRTNTAPVGGAATTPHQAAPTTPHGASTAHQRRIPQLVRKSGRYPLSSILLALVIPLLVVVALLSRVAIRKSRRTVRRRSRRRTPRLTRSAAGARWADVDEDDLERKPPPLPLGRRAK
jgi:hypothetical protein